jgi:hypothetical protein
MNRHLVHILMMATEMALGTISLWTKILEEQDVPQKVATWVRMSSIAPNELKFGTNTF